MQQVVAQRGIVVKEDLLFRFSIIIREQSAMTALFLRTMHIFKGGMHTI